MRSDDSRILSPNLGFWKNIMLGAHRDSCNKSKTEAPSKNIINKEDWKNTFNTYFIVRYLMALETGLFFWIY